MKIQKRQKRTNDELARMKITSEDLYNEWLKNPSQPTERFGQMMIYIADKVLQCASYRGYDQDIKDEIRSEALVKLMKNYKNLSADRKDSFFGYMYQCATCACLTYLGKYYRRKNLEKELKDKIKNEFFESLGQMDPVEDDE